MAFVLNKADVSIVVEQTVKRDLISLIVALASFMSVTFTIFKLLSSAGDKCGCCESAHSFPASMKKRMAATQVPGGAGPATSSARVEMQNL